MTMRLYPDELCSSIIRHIVTKIIVCRLYKTETTQGKVSIAESQFNTIMKENEIKLNEQRRSKYGSVSIKLRGFLKPTGWKPMAILFLLFTFQQFSGIYITLFYAVTWFQVNKYLYIIIRYPIQSTLLFVHCFILICD